MTNFNQSEEKMQRNINETYRKDKINEILNLGNHIIQSRELSEITQKEIITSIEVDYWIQESESIIKDFYSDSLIHFQNLCNKNREEELSYTKFEELRSCFRNAIRIAS